MARTDFTTPRLCLDCDLSEGATTALSLDEANYLLNVLRLTRGARVLAFNGRDGEFAATIGAATRKSATLAIGERIRPQEFPPDVDYLFAPLKHARLDYMAQKAVEMGARRLQPVITRRTQASRVNLARLAANAREAAEQCGVIWLPEVSPERRLEEVLAAWPAERLLIFCDEDAPLANPVAGLATVRSERRRIAADRSRRRIRRERTAGDRPAAARAAPEPRAARAARRHRRGGGAGVDSEPLRRLAMTLWKGARRAFMPPRYRRRLPPSISGGRDEFVDATRDVGRDVFSCGVPCGGGSARRRFRRADRALGRALPFARRRLYRRHRIGRLHSHQRLCRRGSGFLRVARRTRSRRCWRRRIRR